MMTAKELFENYGTQKVQDIRTALDRNNINASGRLSASVQSVYTENTNTYRIQVMALAYIGTVDVGRGATKNSTGDFKVQDIESWIIAKRIAIPAGKNLRQLAYAIYVSINRRGTNQYRSRQRNIIRDAIDLGLQPFLDDVAKMGIDIFLIELAKWQRL